MWSGCALIMFLLFRTNTSESVFSELRSTPNVNYVVFHSSREINCFKYIFAPVHFAYIFYHYWDFFLNQYHRLCALNCSVQRHNAQCVLCTVLQPCSKKCPAATTGQYLQLLQGNNQIPLYLHRDRGIKCKNPVVATGA